MEDMVFGDAIKAVILKDINDQCKKLCKKSDIVPQFCSCQDVRTRCPMILGIFYKYVNTLIFM